MLPIEGDLIAAIATPPGVGGVGIIRVSGKHVPTIFTKVLTNYRKIIPNKAVYSKFINSNGEIIDQGIAIYFQSPHSYTGEDVLELHAHGGPVILNMLLNRVLELGARVAEPGEFSKRAFLANKIDLIQAEAIAGLIAAKTEEAALAASKTLQGDFSQHIRSLLDNLTNIRAHIEALIDFPEDNIEDLASKQVQKLLQDLLKTLQCILATAKSGELLTNGVTAAIIGKPNVGKSSLLNYLAKKPRAIVTNVPGTTRDLINATVNLDGLAIEFIDTAGLRETDNPVEAIGINKAIELLATTDLVILMLTAEEYLPHQANLDLKQLLPPLVPKTLINTKLILLINKIDLLTTAIQQPINSNVRVFPISILKNLGLEAFKHHLKTVCGFNCSDEQSVYMANARHLHALTQVEKLVANSIKLLAYYNNCWDLLAEELRLAQEYLNSITGSFSNEDLLNKIFSEFCIGK